MLFAPNLLYLAIKININFYLLDSRLCSVTELRGNSEICPGDSGIFECQTTNTDELFWSVNGTTLSIPPNHRLENGRITNSGHVASLVELNLTSGNVGDRTSLLRVAPATTNFNTITTVACSGGDPVNTCSRDILFIGKRI